MDGGRFPDFSKVPRAHHHNQVRVNPFLYVCLAEEKCDEAGAEIAYHEFPVAVRKIANGWEVDCQGFGTRRTVRCKQIIDCSGGASVVGMLGFERLREEETQPGSQLYQLDKPDNPGRAGLSRLYVHGADSSNSRTVTRASVVGRMEVLKKVRDSGKTPDLPAAGTRVPREFPHRRRDPHHRGRLHLRTEISGCHLQRLLPRRPAYQIGGPAQTA